MAEAPVGAPVVVLPERIDRRLRLGPFPSARDALKFLCYAAVAAILGATVDLYVGVVVAASGFLAAVWRPDGRSWDERLAAWLRWRMRTHEAVGVMTVTEPSPLLRQGFLSLGPSDYVAVVRTGGVPIAYLPPAELERRFELFRDLLRRSEGRLGFLATLASIRATSFLPPPPAVDGPDRPARDGYAQLVGLLCRRRFGRRVYVVVANADADPDALATLEGQVASMMEALSALGLSPVRLKDRGLAEAAHRLGWTVVPEEG